MKLYEITITISLAGLAASVEPIAVFEKNAYVNLTRQLLHTSDLLYSGRQSSECMNRVSFEHNNLLAYSTNVDLAIAILRQSS